MRLEPRVDCGEFADPAPDSAQAGQNGIVILVQRAVTLRAEALDPFGIREHLALSGELDVLARIPARHRLQVGAIELVELKGDQILTRVSIPGGISDSSQRFLDLTHRFVGRGGGNKKAIKRAEGVERAEMSGGIEQRLVLVLAVQLDEPRRQILQGACRCHYSVDERPAPALSGNLAAHQKFVAAVLENRFDRRRILAGAYKVARRPAAKEESDGLDQDRFAGPGFPGEHVEARVELDLDRIDDREMFDAKKPQHAKKSRKHGEARELQS